MTDGGHIASFQGAFTVTGNLDVTYVPVIISVGNPDYLQRGHYAINKGTFIMIILIFAALSVVLLHKEETFVVMTRVELQLLSLLVGK